jgi:hypothetical protein
VPLFENHFRQTLTETKLAMKTLITALMLVFALASGISLITLAFRTDFREPAAGIGDWPTWNRVGRN